MIAKKMNSARVFKVNEPKSTIEVATTADWTIDFCLNHCPHPDDYGKCKGECNEFIQERRNREKARINEKRKRKRAHKII